MIQENQAALETAKDEWNRGSLEGYLQLYAPDAVLHGYAGVGPGLANIRQFYEAFWVAFPDAKLTYEDTFAADARVACRFVVEATHGGVFQGISPTGNALPSQESQFCVSRMRNVSSDGVRLISSAC